MKKIVTHKAEKQISTDKAEKQSVTPNNDVKIKIAVLISGGGTNLQALIDASETGRLSHGEIALVVSDRPGAYGLTRAETHGIPTLVVEKKMYGKQSLQAETRNTQLQDTQLQDRSAMSQELQGAGTQAARTQATEKSSQDLKTDQTQLIQTVSTFEQDLEAILKERGIELIVLAGFLTILSGAFTAKYPERIINVHPSLIPAFCGKDYYGLRVHEEALKKGVKVTGATVHFVNEIPDGGRILAQKAVDVLPDDTPEILQKRVMTEAEHVLLPEVVEQVCFEILDSRF